MHDSQRPDILHLEACNFVDKPLGGQLNFSRQLIKAMGERVALVGLSNHPSEMVGSWFQKEIDGVSYRFFAIGRDDEADIKPLVPRRLTTWLQIRRYRKQIFSIGIPNILIREHSILMAMDAMPDCNICFYIPGLDSPLSISRYTWAAPFSKYFDRLFFQSLGKKANCILAAADEAAIYEFKKRAGKHLKGKVVFTFPTRIDTDIFFPADLAATRNTLGLPQDAIIAVSTSRIHWAKGWPLLLESFKLFSQRHPISLLIFIGDGADKDALVRRAAEMGITENILLVGVLSPPDIATYLQCANFFVFGSHKEGWSTALLEAMACHLPIVTTRFSSADVIVQNGVNGFVLDQRDPRVFSDAMEKVLDLPRMREHQNHVIDRYALKNLEGDLLRAWRLNSKN